LSGFSARGILEDAAARLSAAGIENARGEARLLLAAALGVPREATLSGALKPTPEQTARFAAMLDRRAAREPFAYIAGRKEFWSLGLAVGPGVLVPRPESETLIEQALLLRPDRAAPLVLADLGTGSGAILIAALSEYRNATGIGFESAPDAHAWAERNAAAHVPGRADIRLDDWNAAPAAAFDLVFSNPPYIASAAIAGLEAEVARHEPRAELDGGPDGLDAYRALGTVLPRILKPGGHALLEIGAGQADCMKSLFPALEMLRIAPDLAGIPRCLVLKNPEKPIGMAWAIR
jgi:release factor glutamine methyltransferase